MRKFLITTLLVTSLGTAFAHGPHGHWRSYPHGGWGWVVPAVVGGVIVYEATRPPVVIQQPQPVIIQQNKVFNDSNCSPWTQIQNSDGSITTTRTCQ